MAAYNEQTRLDEDDAIFASDVEARLTEYLSNPNNTMFSVGERLATGYIGVPDIIRILLQWSSTFTDDPDKVLRQATENALIEMEPRIIPQVNKALSDSDFSIPGIDAISASDTWRPFFIGMAERQQTTVLANALNRQQLLTSAHVNKASFSNPEAFMNEFRNLFSTLSVENMNSSSTSPKLAATQFLNRFSALTTYDECTAKSALYTLDRLSDTAPHPITKMVARRLSQHVRTESVEQIRSIGRAPPPVAAISAKTITREEADIHIARQAILTKCVSYDCSIRPQVVEAIVTVALSRGDVGDFRSAISLENEIKIITNFFATMLVGAIYAAGNHPLGDKQALPSSFRLNPITFHEKLVLIRAVCDEFILEPLLQAAFSVKRRPTPDDALSSTKKRALCLLLAFAHECHKLDDEELLSRLQSEEETKNLCSSVCSRFQRIELFVSTCETLKPGCATYQIKEEIGTLKASCDDPFLVRGLLIWATEGLLGGSNLRDLRKTAVMHLAFLAMVADKHLALRDGVVDAIRQAMSRDYGDLEDMEIAEIKAQVMRCISGLVRRGLGLQMVKLFLNHLVDSDVIDIAHLRSFVLDLLTSVKPPFSDEFVCYVQKLIATDRLQMALASSSSSRRQTENPLGKAVAKFQKTVTRIEIS